MSYIDVILLAIIGIVVLVSVKSGFFKTLFDLVGYIVAIIVAKNASLLLAKNAFDTFIRGGAQEYLDSVVSEITTEQLPEQTDRVISTPLCMSTSSRRRGTTTPTRTWTNGPTHWLHVAPAPTLPRLARLGKFLSTASI